MLHNIITISVNGLYTPTKLQTFLIEKNCVAIYQLLKCTSEIKPHWNVSNKKNKEILNEKVFRKMLLCQ